jgi:hypothetical protein
MVGAIISLLSVGPTYSPKLFYEIFVDASIVAKYTMTGYFQYGNELPGFIKQGVS